ncbi:ABC transporter ATP-binding protein [Conexibacter woesei]|uniref:ABC transporter related protein n=1 Tax=Conexibacter woesei (strain DSM 14684 / CCUG 47730 / CIP 108061 / JCM 11494 / NBRC 100937 / ID131577) TaxID=469383 RepID=D3FBT9_CONWI|nr:sn-glycerol-3-phosphate ABC transporter ATP-binding protein UgpC [Conexibacter woesei]ADB51354.1 ABC transporter related protein [Conexibacter woesei DSM 14684]
MAEVTLDRVSKVYPDGTRAVSSMDLEIGDQEFMVLVGPSGCGKTTALRMVAGLEEISEGAVRIGERVVNDVPSRDRDIAMVFQSYALYPHLSVYENIAFGLRLKKIPKDEIDRRVREAARVLDLTEWLKRKPRNLSGGQRQRVAMGRAIVREPQAFLMDEPLSNLDAKLRVQMRAEIARLQDDLGVTTIYVTHDQIEAMTMGDRVAVMRKGRLQQVATPQELYDHPVNLFVGGFIGSPAMNLVEAIFEQANGGFAVRLGDQRLGLPQDLVDARPALSEWVGRELVLGIRPESLEDAAETGADTPSDRRLRAQVTLREALGSEVDIHATIAARPARTDEVKELAADKGLQSLDAEAAEATIVGRLAPRSKAAEGDAIELAVDTTALHFFDPESGLGIYDAKTEGATP